MFKTWNELSRKEQLECIFWDAYKDAYGFRPRGHNISTMTEQELEHEISELAQITERNQKQEELEQQEAITRFEKRVEETIALGAKNRETAIKWIHDAEDTGGDDEYLCYRLGLPYTYFKEVA